MRLSDWLDETSTTQGKLAREIHCTQTTISRYLSGARVPRPEQMLAIYRATGGRVAPNDFYNLQGE
jgi:DNA-binding transcriptional regulator YdaS (Cro superfamily)